jgi:hypothetical protein
MLTVMGYSAMTKHCAEFWEDLGVVTPLGITVQCGKEREKQTQIRDNAGGDHVAEECMKWGGIGYVR